MKVVLVRTNGRRIVAKINPLGPMATLPMRPKANALRRYIEKRSGHRALDKGHSWDVGWVREVEGTPKDTWKSLMKGVHNPVKRGGHGSAMHITLSTKGHDFSGIGIDGHVRIEDVGYGRKKDLRIYVDTFDSDDESGSAHLDSEFFPLTAGGSRAAEKWIRENARAEVKLSLPVKRNPSQARFVLMRTDGRTLVVWPITNRFQNMSTAKI